MTTETFGYETGVLAVGFQLVAYETGKPPAAGILVFFGILDHKFNLSEGCRFGGHREGWVFFGLPGDLGQYAAVRQRFFAGLQCGNGKLVAGDDANLTTVLPV